MAVALTLHPFADEDHLLWRFKGQSRLLKGNTNTCNHKRHYATISAKCVIRNTNLLGASNEPGVLEGDK